MAGWDSFTVAVMTGGAVVVGVLILMIIFDKGKPSVTPASAPARSAKR
jgi:hypothetical protein